MLSANLNSTINGDYFTVNFPISFLPSYINKKNVVLNVTENDGVISMRPTELTPEEKYEINMRALMKIQKEMEGEAEKAGIYSEEDVIRICKEIRREGSTEAELEKIRKEYGYKRYENND
jgi:hypothetical protein